MVADSISRRLTADSRLSALVIGIDSYQHQAIGPLRGAVNDAREITEYLQQELGIPPSRIIYLVNQLATREGIIDAFVNKLQKLPGLERGSPLLIYFAGHGARVMIDNNTRQEMEALIPYDCDSFWGGATHPILDKTISSLVESVYERIGDNILFISDCCHSGSITRGGNVRKLTIPEAYRYPTNFDSKLISTILPNGSTATAARTHVLLAACGELEPAEEKFAQDVWHGEFTRALLALFKSTSISRLTPGDVLFRLTQDLIRQQNPQCRGENRMRYFFDGAAPALTWYRVTYDDDDSSYIVNGGSLHGISGDAIFNVFMDRGVDDQVRIGYGKVTSLGPFRSHINITPKGGRPTVTQSKTFQNGFALLHNVGCVQHPQVFIEEPTTTTGTLSRALNGLTNNEHQIYPIRGTHRDDCLFSLKEEAGKIILANLDPRLSFPDSPDILPVQFPADPDKIRNIMAHVAEFFYHLDNGSTEDHQPPGVEIEIVQIGELNRKRQLVRRSRGDNLLKDGCLSVIDTRTPPQPTYGINIKNRSEFDWFVSIFYFDGANHTIDRLYGSGSAGKFKADPCIPKASEREFGFGNGEKNMRPIALKVSEEARQTEFGTLKFIFTSAPVNFSSIISTSSLQAVSKRGLDEYDIPDCESSDGEWGTLCIPVVITKRKDESI
ncbi:caspase domain-containing protein [Crepidotus variabilis]|uniref:Caspase domain-containing protein n=1 Tax=Crepidotus variabilis TaxID=179855 RepID=A0A9P6JQV5_9AGAR|nr:caspase domain-containing protein [Crepidotus variabilis]